MVDFTNSGSEVETSEGHSSDYDPPLVYPKKQNERRNSYTPSSGTQQEVHTALRLVIGRWVMAGAACLLGAFLVPLSLGYVSLYRQVDRLVTLQEQTAIDVKEIKEDQENRPRVELVNSWLETLEANLESNKKYSAETRSQLKELRSRLNSHLDGSRHTSADAMFKNWAYEGTMQVLNYNLPKSYDLEPLEDTTYVISKRPGYETLKTSMDESYQGEPLALISPVPFKQGS